MLVAPSRAPDAASLLHDTLRDTSVVHCPLSCSPPSPPLSLLPLLVFPRCLLRVYPGFCWGRGGGWRGGGG